MERAGLAAQALVQVLRRDLRVKEKHLAWQRSLPQDLRRYKTKTDDLAALDRFLQEDLKLNYGWLAPLLLFDFGAQVVDAGSILVTPEDVGLPAGRRAKGKGEHIARDVEWLYRAEIKSPADSVRSLGREYLTTLSGPQRAGDGRAAVEAGIKRARRLLAIFVDDTPLPK